jgi:hypothetical protein
MELFTGIEPLFREVGYPLVRDMGPYGFCLMFMRWINISYESPTGNLKVQFGWPSKVHDDPKRMRSPEKKGNGREAKDSKACSRKMREAHEGVCSTKLS